MHPDGSLLATSDLGGGGEENAKKHDMFFEFLVDVVFRFLFDHYLIPNLVFINLPLPSKLPGEA